MCLINYNKKTKKYKHLSYAEKTMIERWHNKEHKSNKEIAELLNKSERTIRREIKRGLTTNLTTYYEEIEVYSADISNDEYKANSWPFAFILALYSSFDISALYTSISS